MNFIDNQINYNNSDREDTSEIIMSEGTPVSLNFDTLSNSSFTNIQVLHSSHATPVVIYTATRYGKRYTLKGLSPDFRNDPVHNLLLTKEFEIGLALEHPNIRQTIGFEEVEDLGKVIVLEYIDGTSLKKYLETHKLTSFQARQIVRQIASALKYMHSKQIIHKDLKSSNILITHQGQYVKLIDFNLSDSDSYAILKCNGGTKDYIAPELRKGNTNPNNLSDIYSFGVIIRELADKAQDNSLLNLSALMTEENPAMRPQSVEEITLPKPDKIEDNTLMKLISSKLTTFICVLICLLLLIFIFFTAKSRHLL